MADYYPLIARAIAGLDPSAPGESRRALYERARAALIAQLRSVQPPLSESEITRERLSLEEAVRKVESEAAQRARQASRPGGPGPAPARASPGPGGRARQPQRAKNLRKRSLALAGIRPARAEHGEPRRSGRALFLRRVDRGGRPLRRAAAADAAAAAAAFADRPER